MKKYEYKTISMEATGFMGGQVDVQELDERLNAYGMDGWELIGMVSSNQSYGSTRFILVTFKRERVM